jgi:hypothetical protein
MNMYVLMYLCTYVCICMYMYVCMHLCTYVWMYVFCAIYACGSMYVFMRVYTCTHKHIYTHTHARKHTHINTHNTHTHTHIYIQTYAHTHMHTRIYAPILRLSAPRHIRGQFRKHTYTGSTQINSLRVQHLEISKRLCVESQKHACSLILAALRSNPCEYNAFKWLKCRV